MNRFFILKFLCSANFFIPSSLTNPSRFIFLNTRSVLSGAVFVVVVHHTYVETSFILSYSPAQFRRRPKEGDDPTAESVIYFSHVFPHMLSGVLNICFRIASWILLPRLMKCYKTLVALKLISISEFPWNELIFLLLALASISLRVWQLWIRKLPLLSFDEIMGVWGITVGESFPLHLAGVVLVCVVTLISSNLDRIGNILKAAVQCPIAWTVEASNFESNARNYLGIKTFLKSEMPYNYKRLPSLKRIREIRRSYFELHDLWKDAAGISGTLTFLLFMELTISISFQSFLAVTSFVEAENTNSSDKKIDYLLTIHAVLYALCSIGIAVCIGNVGYSLQKSGENLYLSLLQFIWEFQNASMDFSHEDLVREKYLSLLLETVSQNKIKLTALGFFTVSRSTLTSIAGVIVTYLVVLIQFRTSSSSDTC